MNALNISALPLHMDAVLPLALIFTCTLLMMIIMRHAAQKRKAQGMLLIAKEETEGIAQLAMTNPHPLIRLTGSGTISFINPAALDIFEDILKSGARHPIFAGIDFSAITKEALERDMLYDNKIFHQNILRVAAGSETAFVIHCIDITNLKKTENALQASLANAEKSRRDAEHAKDARGEFLANMSHELRTPMNGIIGLSGILYENETDPEKKRLGEAVYYSATNLLGLLNDILDFSKIEAEELTIETIPFELPKLLHDAEMLHKPAATSKGLGLIVQTDRNMPPILIGDPLRLQQILNNLISNAIKFTPQGHVNISASVISNDHKNCTLALSVADTGIGIPEDKHALVFEKFQQANTSTSRHYGGTGLGLSITKRLCELMGGALSLQSKETEGTTVTLTLDFQVAGTQAATRTKPQKDGKMDYAGSILIADDHPVNLLFLRNVLEKAGMSDIDEAINGLQAVTLYGQRQHGLILMDCQMPEMDGYEAARTIRAAARQTGHMPVIIAITADAMKGAIQKAMQAGMNDYISKPVEKARLFEIMAQHLGKSVKTPTSISMPVSIPLRKTDNPSYEIYTKDKNMDDLPILDRSVLQDYSGGDTETEAMMIRIFTDNLHIDIKSLQAALDSGNYKDWSAIIHKIYGGCANLGAKRMAALCDTAQDIPSDNVLEIQRAHEKILYHSRAAIQELSAITNGFAAA